MGYKIEYRYFVNDDNIKCVEIICNGIQIDIIPAKELDNLYPEWTIRENYNRIKNALVTVKSGD